MPELTYDPNHARKEVSFRSRNYRFPLLFMLMFKGGGSTCALRYTMCTVQNLHLIAPTLNDVSKCKLCRKNVFSGLQKYTVSLAKDMIPRNRKIKSIKIFKYLQWMSIRVKKIMNNMTLVCTNHGEVHKSEVDSPRMLSCHCQWRIQDFLFGRGDADAEGASIDAEGKSLYMCCCL